MALLVSSIPVLDDVPMRPYGIVQDLILGHWSKTQRSFRLVGHLPEWFKEIKVGVAFFIVAVI